MMTNPISHHQTTRLQRRGLPTGPPRRSSRVRPGTPKKGSTESAQGMTAALEAPLPASTPPATTTRQQRRHLERQERKRSRNDPAG